ncbi:hypothetical protein [Silvibacterium dinghuense]|uniref:Uncharacterized protein n=1 Tax=Silvibacterium dinghuense TaxID=1560006 RepID=A0A4V1NV36_9BACT|nr:hypothetical protein [Silvibacterium dinghuense]RXS94392.1 hypothetical protein ESZ00_15045 [Silvibacterium dinghuense]GGH16410.1 hypothetical protein GCM10011586_38220 [Silvibacterium dinghuense]
MRKWGWSGVLVLGMLCWGACATAHAQDAQSTVKADAHDYALDFLVKEINAEGKVANSRNYHVVLSGDHRNSTVRSGTKVPIQTGTNGIQYLDLGVSIDCSNTQETPTGVSIRIGVEVSSLAEASGSSATPGTPVVRQNKWETNAVLPLGKPMQLFSSDNLENKGKMEFEVTATRIP